MLFSRLDSVAGASDQALSDLKGSAARNHISTAGFAIISDGAYGAVKAIHDALFFFPTPVFPSFKSADMGYMIDGSTILRPFGGISQIKHVPHLEWSSLTAILVMCKLVLLPASRG